MGKCPSWGEKVRRQQSVFKIQPDMNQNTQFLFSVLTFRITDVSNAIKMYFFYNIFFPNQCQYWFYYLSSSNIFALNWGETARGRPRRRWVTSNVL